MRTFGNELRIILQKIKSEPGKPNADLFLFLRLYFLTISPLLLMFTACHFYRGNIPLLVLLFITSGFVQNALIILMHEGSHYFIHHNRQINDRLADILFCFALVNTVDGYRQEHLLHHKYSGGINDPYWDTYTYKDKWQFLRLFLCDLFFITAVEKFYTRYLKKKVPSALEKDPAKSNTLYVLTGLFVVQSLLFLAFYWLTGYVWGYFLFWILPLMTIPAAINRIRTIVEHHSQTGMDANRSVVPGFLEYCLIAPYGYSYHFIHHHTVTLPYYYLKFAHEQLKILGVTLNDEEVCDGYLKTFFNFFKRMPN